MHNYKELKMWQKSIELCVLIYQATQQFPGEEKFGLTSQLRKASVSIPSNIAEGAGRKSNKEFAYFLSIARGSCYETETQVIIAEKLNYIIEMEEIFKLIEEIQKMMFVFTQKLESKIT